MNDGLRQFTDDKVLIAAHRGRNGSNIVVNTCDAFEIALRQGASILELDLVKSADGEIFVFHTGLESRYLGKPMDLTKMTSQEIKRLRLLNSDLNETDRGVELFENVLEMTKNRCILNLDRCGGFFDDVAPVIEKHGMENQILMKCAPTREAIARIESSAASRCMYIPILWNSAEGWNLVKESQLNLVGAELVFLSEESELIRDGFVDKLHKEGLAAWGNSLVYSYETPLAAGHSDDNSLTKDPALGWGWLVDHGFDIIQTDWTGDLHQYLVQRGLASPKFI